MNGMISFSVPYSETLLCQNSLINYRKEDFRTVEMDFFQISYLMRYHGDTSK